MKIKITPAELKKQRDALQQYERYLPTLLLKKQQLQLEILHQQRTLQERENSLSGEKRSAGDWAGLLVEFPGIRRSLVPDKIITGKKNIAGVDLPVFDRVEFKPADYDLFLTPFWVDAALERLTVMVSLREEIRILEDEISILKHELRITTQRVNLFEKVKIPDAKEAIRQIKIYIGDQMTNAVGRSKLAKNKIEEAEFGEMAI